MALTATQMAAWTDKFARAYAAIRGTAASSYGAGDSTQALGSDWGYSKAIRDAMILLIGTSIAPGFGDAGAIGYLYTPTTKIQAVNDIADQCKDFAPMLGALDRLCQSFGIGGVTDLITFCTYYNLGAGGPYNCLLCPDFTAMRALALPGATAMPVTNIYAPGIADMGHRTVGGAFVAGTTVDTAKYAGAGRIQAVVAGWAGAADTVTVTSGARKADGTIVAGRTWTAIITADGTVGLAPGVAGDLATGVTAITMPPLMVAGTITITAVAPAGRVYPPS